MPKTPNPTQTVVQRPEIYRYHDYRELLKDWLAYRKASQRGFSMRVLAKEAELATGYLPMVLAGKRHLSEKALRKLSPLLGLTKPERSFLEALVILGTSDSQTVRLEALERIKKFRTYRELNPKEIEVSRYLTHWYYVAIRELADLPGFKADPEWIQSQLRVQVPLGEIKDALEFLIENKFIEGSQEEGFELALKPLECVGGVYRLALSQFHREMLDLAAQSIENTPSDERHIVGHSFALKPSDFGKAQEIIQDALIKIQALGESKRSEDDSVYHLELAFFPLTRRNRK